MITDKEIKYILEELEGALIDTHTDRYLSIDSVEEALNNLKKQGKTLPLDSISERLDVNDKVKIIANCDEVTVAVKMLIGLMEDVDLKNYVEIGYEVLGQKYKLEFKKT